LATISPAESSHQETISTLRFLERAKRVVLQSQRNDSFSRLGDDAVSSEAIGKALKQVQDLELQVFVVRRELQASQGENVRLEEQLKLKEINEENNPKAANEPSGDVDAYSEAHKWKEELDYLKLELTSARDQLSVKSIELDCAVETHAHQIREYEQTVADLQDRLRQAVSNELDAVREKNELTNYYTELLLDTTTKLEETSTIMDASFSTTAGSASSDEDRELVKCLVDSMCAMCENNLLKDQLGLLEQQYQQLQEDNTAINSELLDEYQHHESDIESVQTKLESDFSVKLEENRTITRDTALSAIRTNEIRRGQQFLELSKQVQDYHSRVEQLTQLRHQEMELYTMREQELRAEFDRAVRSIAKASRLGEANSSDQAHALEELQSEVALLNITLFNLKADQISPSQECLTKERIEEQSKQVVISPASLPDTGTENTTTTTFYSPASNEFHSPSKQQGSTDSSPSKQPGSTQSNKDNESGHESAKDTEEECSRLSVRLPDSVPKTPSIPSNPSELFRFANFGYVVTPGPELRRNQQSCVDRCLNSLEYSTKRIEELVANYELANPLDSVGPVKDGAQMQAMIPSSLSALVQGNKELLVELTNDIRRHLFLEQTVKDIYSGVSSATTTPYTSPVTKNSGPTIDGISLNAEATPAKDSASRSAIIGSSLRSSKSLSVSLDLADRRELETGSGDQEQPRGEGERSDGKDKLTIETPHRKDPASENGPLSVNSTKSWKSTASGTGSDWEREAKAALGITSPEATGTTVTPRPGKETPHRFDHGPKSISKVCVSELYRCQ
jgi:hypothetical protein